MPRIRATADLKDRRTETSKWAGNRHRSVHIAARSTKKKGKRIVVHITKPSWSWACGGSKIGSKIGSRIGSKIEPGKIRSRQGRETGSGGVVREVSMYEGTCTVQECALRRSKHLRTRRTDGRVLLYAAGGRGFGTAAAERASEIVDSWGSLSFHRAEVGPWDTRHATHSHLGWKLPTTMQKAVEMQPKMISHNPPALHFLESVKSTVVVRLPQHQQHSRSWHRCRSKAGKPRRKSCDCNTNKHRCHHRQHPQPQIEAMLRWKAGVHGLKRLK